MTEGVNKADVDKEGVYLDNKRMWVREEGKKRGVRTEGQGEDGGEGRGEGGGKGS